MFGGYYLMRLMRLPLVTVTLLCYRRWQMDESA
jgi:hypothetical protein